MAKMLRLRAFLCRVEKRWIAKPPADMRDVASLQAAIHLSQISARLLVRLGVKSHEDALLFFRPSAEHLHDPFLMKDMDTEIGRAHV